MILAILVALSSVVGTTPGQLAEARSHLEDLFRTRSELIEPVMLYKGELGARPDMIGLLTQFPIKIHQLLSQHLIQINHGYFEEAVRELVAENRISIGLARGLASNWSLRCVMGLFYTTLRPMDQDPCHESGTGFMQLADQVAGDLIASLRGTSLGYWNLPGAQTYADDQEYLAQKLLANPLVARGKFPQLTDEVFTRIKTYVVDRIMLPLDIHTRLAYNRFRMISPWGEHSILTQEELLLKWTFKDAMKRNRVWESVCALELWRWFSVPNGQPPCYLDTTGTVMILNGVSRLRLVALIRGYLID